MLMLGEAEGRSLAGTLALAWGDSVVAKIGGWCGDRSAIHPNSSIDVESMRWGRELGMRWFDFDGVPAAIARAAKPESRSPTRPATGRRPTSSGSAATSMTSRERSTAPRTRCCGRPYGSRPRG